MTTPFRITKPGDYRMRNGRKAVVTLEDPGDQMPWLSKRNIWYDHRGSVFGMHPDEFDIVAPWKPKPRKRRAGKGRRFRNEPQNVTDKCWYYEEPKGLHVVLESPTGGTTLMAVIPWRMIAGSLGRRGGRSRP